MPLGKFMKSGGMVALAAGLAVAALPSAASAAPGDREGRGNWQGQRAERGNNGGGERRGSEMRGGGEGRGNWGNREQRAAPAPAPARAAQAPREQPQARNWGGDRNGNAPGRGWGSQRPDGQRWGRDRATGEVNRPAPAVQAQRSYTDRNRNTSYTPRQQGWDGQHWNGQNWDRNNDGRPDRWQGDRDRRRWDGNRDGRRWDGDRDGRRWDGDRTRNWSRDWRRDNRYNWQSYRSSNRHIYRLGRYYAPYRDYSYRRLSIGFYLSSGFFGSKYLINDPWQYRLPPAYGPYRWVRYYDDALLVNVYDGEVVDVIYDFFW